MHPFHIILVIFAAVALIGFTFVLRREYRQLSARGLSGPGLKVRLSGIPALLVIAALVILPARGTSGMEGLAVFYGMLIVVAPVLWFGAHWLAGRFTRPQLAFADTARVAISPLVYVLVMVVVAHSLQSTVWSLLKSVGLM
jgi:hypothetical protein